jgi:glycosyltransferase involved in cell wall biosynthesis
VREVRNGVTITRLRTTGFGRSSVVGRLTDYASFYVQALLRLLGRRRWDGVVFLTTPPLIAFVGWVARLLRGQRYGIWSMDLHPDAEIAAGMIRPRAPLGRFLCWANAASYRAADFVVDLGRHMKRRIVAKGVRAERTHTVHVWSRRGEVEPTAREANPLLDELGLRDRFVVMYSGNAGIVHDFRDILEAMRLLRDDPRIFFLFVGDGPQRARIEAYAAQHRITNFRYRDYFGREQLRHSLSVADVHLISLRAPFVGVSVPGKLYGIMASGRPALFVGPEQSESAETVLEARCGEVVDPERGDGAERIVRALRAWQADPESARAAGARGRAAFLERYELAANCRAFERVIAEAWRGASAGAVAESTPRTALARS